MPNPLLDTYLRAARPTAPADLVAAIAARHGVRPARPDRRPFAVLGALAAAVGFGLVWDGGVSSAATALRRAATSVQTVVVTHVHQTAIVPSKTNAGGDQYKPGYGFGDPNHNHTGPPGVKDGPPGKKAPPPQTSSTTDGKAVYVTATLTVDEQAALYFSVLDTDGTQLLLTQKGTVIGTDVEGPQTKTIHYVMLVPRTITFRIRIPANLVQAGGRYSVRVIAVDAQGNKTTTLIPFTI